MTQKVSMVKLLVAILMILATPLLFFRSVGDNPLKVEKNATQSIAIVNEDAGTEVDGNPCSSGATSHHYSVMSLPMNGRSSEGVRVRTALKHRNMMQWSTSPPTFLKRS